MSQEQTPAIAKPSNHGRYYLMAVACGLLVGNLFDLAWQLVLFCGFFGAGLWFCVLTVHRSIRVHSWLPAGFGIGLFLMVAGMLLDLVAKTL